VYHISLLAVRSLCTNATGIKSTSLGLTQPSLLVIHQHLSGVIIYTNSVHSDLTDQTQTQSAITP